MHRKYVKGKRSKKTSKQKSSESKKNNRKMNGHQKEQVSPIISPHKDFLSRVASIPVVHAAMGYASDAYIKTKVSFLIALPFFCPNHFYVYFLQKKKIGHESTVAPKNDFYS